MTRRTWMILSLAVAALAVGYAVTTVGRSSKPAATGVVAQVAGASSETGNVAESVGTSGTEANAIDLSGLWRFDPASSDMPRRGERGAGDRTGGPGFGRGPGGERRGGGADGGWRRGAGGPGRDGGPRGRFGGRMPSLIEIHQNPGAVMLADSSGEPFVEIRFDGTAPKTPKARAPQPGSTTTGDGPRVMAGHWHDGVLQVEREGRNGMKTVQSFALEDGGRTLVVRNQMPSEGDRPARDIKRVYKRVAGS